MTAESTPDPIFSIVIPVWNGAAYLPACLESLAAQTACRPWNRCEIIAVDNASVDDSAAVIESLGGAVRLLRNPSNLGFGGGCNRGLAAARGEILVVLNQDTTVVPGWLEALSAVFEDPQVGIAGCRILYPGSEIVQHTGGRIDWPLGLAHHLADGDDQPLEREWVTGAALAMRRAVYSEIGGFDEGFWPGYFEDTDLCLRARAKGYKVLYVPDAVVYHQESTSLTDRRQLNAAYQRGRLRFVLKHLSPDRWLREFVPAERAFQREGMRGQDSITLHLAYLWTMLTAGAVLREQWQAPLSTQIQVYDALQELYHQSWHDERERLQMGVNSLWRLWPQPLPTVDATSPVAEPPVMDDIRFHSSLPIVGPLVSGLRTLWYNMAARWALAHLRRQQEVINRVQAAQIEQLQRQINVLVHENELLARQLAGRQTDGSERPLC